MPKSMSLSSLDLTSFKHLLYDRAVAIYLELVRNIQEYVQPLIGKRTIVGMSEMGKMTLMYLLG